MATRDYDSYIFRRGVSPNTMSVISSKNRIYAVNAQGLQKQIGVIATFDPSESRTIEAIRGIGFGDHIAELVPGVTEAMTISVTRSALYTSNIFQVFGYKAGIDGLVRSLRYHRWPFDIRQEVVFSRLAFENTLDKAELENVTPPDGDDPNTEGGQMGKLQALVTIYEACWLSDYGVSYASDTALVQETCTINVSDVLSQTAFDQYTDNQSYDNLATDGPGISQRLVGSNA